MLKTTIKILFALSLTALPAICADWSPRLTADYLDRREKEWFAWKTAQTPAGPCVSCHTNVMYMLARPELRRKLGEAEPTEYETGLRSVLHADFPFTASFAKEPRHTQASGVAAVHAALLLGDEPSLERLWSLQIKEGDDRGAWGWFHLDLDPWEMPQSTFYGAALAAVAVGNASPEHRARHREQIALLIDYLKREREGQPLHNRLMLLWASSKLPGIAVDQHSLVEEAVKLQQPDGGWSIESLGPWKRPSRSQGSDAYATAFTTYMLLKSHNRPKAPLNAALEWLKSHQNEQGAWASTSMNKPREPGSMIDQFMQDAATGFAALALLER